MTMLGMVMAKSGSVRTPNKNIADIVGRPMLAYVIESLKASNVVYPVVVSTDSDAYAELAMKHGADGVVMREPEWDIYPFFLPCADSCRRRYQEDTARSFDAMAVVGANNMFLRPSWLRVAYELLNNYLNNGMPIDVVTNELRQTNVLVCRVRQGITRTDDFYPLKHVGLLMEIDYGHEVELARDIVHAIADGVIGYPLHENIHDRILDDMKQSPNRMGGLSLRSELRHKDR